ncbi:alpha/beta-hydrolase [Aaosphaeria arxii CBS 175.79]|uniref:Alpha/beta-hydrolase n=1 Tax=Aaosphaeria arxii CBS 175.79 TaxID=1450172 RepID=A0A6A5XK07_9PLEO|nr:alpha/beta-hydrolase [Aaosphaeria arxii CBS 175.79]KAF2013585.1 alpha/beta-hydrolase [Aaosphaeria arxii CBS 175.79]
MSPKTNPDPTALSQTFSCTTSTHTFTLKWTSLGDPNSAPLIFIHGTPWSSRVWKPFALALSRHYHVYLFDNPGFGDSPLEKPLPNAPETQNLNNVVELDADLARQSEAYAHLFKHWQQSWGDKKPHVVAHDHGGLMSLRAYLLHDCEYASLCLINVVAIGPFGQGLFRSVAENPESFRGLPDVAFEGILESYIRQAAYFEVGKEMMGVLKGPWVREGGKKGLVRQLCQANWRSTEEVEGRYGEVGEGIPVKVIWGVEDRWIPVETAGRLGEALKAREVVIVEEAGHLSFIDQAGQVGVELGTWLRDVSGKDEDLERRGNAA